MQFLLKVDSHSFFFFPKQVYFKIQDFTFSGCAIDTRSLAVYPVGKFKLNICKYQCCSLSDTLTCWHVLRIENKISIFKNLLFPWQWNLWKRHARDETKKTSFSSLSVSLGDSTQFSWLTPELNQHESRINFLVGYVSFFLSFFFFRSIRVLIGRLQDMEHQWWSLVRIPSSKSRVTVMRTRKAFWTKILY